MLFGAADPDCYQALLEAKTSRTAQMLAPFEPPDPVIVASSPSGFRMRVEFRMWHSGEDLNYVMFDPANPKVPVPVQSMPIAHAQIQQLMPMLLAQLRASPTLRRKLFQSEFLATTAGDLLVTLVYHRALDTSWEQAAQALRKTLEAQIPGLSLIGRSRKQKIVLGREYVREALEVQGSRYQYRQYEQGFSQPNAGVNVRMIEWACKQAAAFCTGDLLELYCGNGNFTLPLSRHFDTVIATEVSKRSTRAARENLADNAIGNVYLLRLSAEEMAQALRGDRVFRRLEALPNALSQYQLNTLFVDPPRAGLDAQTTAIASDFEIIIYVSCNPQSLARDLQTLCVTHAIRALALFDQFPYTDHLECGVVLCKRIRESR
ncbi:MAG: tRNA (uridine(54)-C5)-methyltransferase TrmA [Halioglobus sp.]|nr:tRNA (uridine(54)-C5)-methyltransferase TrmA [Halioglobus sp.]